jgi:hypothetical protein
LLCWLHRAEPCRHLAVPDPLLPLLTTAQSEKGNLLANHHSLPTTPHCTPYTPYTPHKTQERLFSHQTPVSAHGLMIPTLFAPSSRTWILTYQANLGPRRPVRPVTLSLVQPLPALAAHALFLRLPSIMIFRGGPQRPSKPPTQPSRAHAVCPPLQLLYFTLL